MSLARAFTARRVKESLGFGGSSGNDRDSGLMSRSNTTSSVRRSKISAPIELLSTTNMLSYNAPDIYPRTASSTASSATAARSSDDDLSDAALTSASTPPTSPEMDPKPKRTHSSTASKAEPRHLSIFPAPAQVPASLNRMASSSSAAIGPPMPSRMIIPPSTRPEPQRVAPPPAIPLRTPSYRNTSYELARAPVRPQEQPRTKTSHDSLIAQQHAKATYENALSRTWSSSRLSEQPQRTPSTKSSKSSFHTSRSSSASSGTTNTSLSPSITTHSHHLSAAGYLQQQQKQLRRDLHQLQQKHQQVAQQLQQKQRQVAKGKASSPISSPSSPMSGSLDAPFSIPVGLPFSPSPAPAFRPQQQQQQQQLQSREAQIQPQEDHSKDYAPSHPFGTELAQVTELAKEFQRGVRSSNLPSSAAAAAAYNHVHLTSIADEEEEEELINKGLLKFSADDYLGEIQGLITNFFGDMRGPKVMVQPMWI